jgi:4-hydroxyphenylacetate 3-monooxygenase
MSSRVRTGAQFLAALRDTREVYLDGKRVADVTTEPGLSTVAHTFARMYDLAHDPEYEQALTFVDEATGDRINGAWIEPRTREAIEWRRGLTELIARQTGGLFGRQPDYVALFYLGMLDIRRDFSQGEQRFEKNIADYWQFCRDNDLALSHGFIDPQLDPGIPVQDSALLKVVGRNEEGIVVRGVKTVATFATHADEVFVGSFPRPGQTDAHVVYFALPIATPGMRVVARTVYGEGNPFDHPVSMYGDENDCMLIFDDVHVPWERVFSLGNPEFCMTVFPRITEWGHWSILPRLAVKAEVLVGIFALLPAMLGRSKTPAAQEALGEILRYLTTLRAFVRAAEDAGRLSTSGYWMPDPTFVSAGRAYSVEHYRRIINYLHDLGTQSLVNMPTEGMLDNPVVGPALEAMLSGPNGAARDRARLTNLARDLVADSFGGRQTLFELFNALPWTQQRELLTMRFDVEPYKQLALATAGAGDLGAAGQVMAAVTSSTGGIDYHAVGEAYLARHHDGATSARAPDAAPR